MFKVWGLGFRPWFQFRFNFPSPNQSFSCSLVTGRLCLQFAADAEALLMTKDASLRALQGLANIIEAAVVALGKALDPEEEEEDVLGGMNARAEDAPPGQKQLETFIMAQALIASMVSWTLNCNWRCMEKVLERVGAFVNENQSRLRDQDALGTAEADQIDHRLRMAEEQCRQKFVEQQSERPLPPLPPSTLSESPCGATE
jgi:hypothetical protein